MKLKLSTTKLQEAVAKAVRGASNNKMLPITSFMALEGDADGNLILTTTDGTNVLKVTEKGVVTEPFYLTVSADLFSKLIARTTTPEITLEIGKASLEVFGNGSYVLELPFDEDGNPIVFKTFNLKADVMETVEIDSSVIKLMLSANKAAIAETMETPVLTGYYCYEGGVLTTNALKVCSTSLPIFKTPVMLSSELVELLAVHDSPKIHVKHSEGKLVFQSEDVIVYGMALAGVDDYPVDAIKAYLETEFKTFNTFSKAAMLAVLDRLSLFVAPYDKNGVYLTMTNQGLMFSSKKNNGVETIPYAEKEEFTPYTCCIDIELFRSQIMAQDGEKVVLWYGHDKAIKMTQPNVTQILALMEDDRVLTTNG